MGYSLKKAIEVFEYFPLNTPSSLLTGKLLRKFSGAATALMPSQKGKAFWESLRFGFSDADRMLQGKRFDLLIVENLQLLPLAMKVKGEAKVLFDAREYYPKEFEGKLWFEILEKKRRVDVCRKYLPLCDAVLTVSEGLRKEYLREFGVDARVYRSTPLYSELSVRPTDPKRIRMVYHGAALRDRKLENLIEIFKMLDERFYLDLILVGNPGYQKELRYKASGMSRIAFPPAVPFETIIPTIARYDIGFFYYEPSGFNVAHCLPNKLFEYIQARLMLAIGPCPDMAQLVEQYQCGVVAESFSLEAMAKKLNALSVSDIDAAKQRSDRASKELCFENESERFAEVLEVLLNCSKSSAPVV
jgi:glycosyltransferase involved in cell wall biosynthesis